jgi:exopolysaccharide production protein ExoZ
MSIVLTPTQAADETEVRQRARPKAERVVSLDALRGLMACGVMFYHYFLWSQTQLSTGMMSVAGKTGIYAVEIFYVISGFSLAYVYAGTPFRNVRNIARFLVKRFFRIAPLFFACAAAMILAKLAFGERLPEGHAAIEPLRMLLNFTFLFGLINPAESLVVAGWSIGLEAMFYLLFPVLMLLFRRRSAAWAALGLCFVMLAVFAFGVLTRDAPLDAQWPTYVSLPNHLFFFVAGVALATFRPVVHDADRPSKALIGLALLAAIIGVFVPFVYPSEIELVTGAARLWLSCVSCLLVFLMAHYAANQGALSRVFGYLGDISYSVYLTHFFVFYGLAEILNRSSLDPPAPVRLGMAVVATVVVSHISFRVIEKPGMNLGSRFARAVSP